MNAQEQWDALPGHYVKVTVEAEVHNGLIGKWAYPNHPKTVLNPNGVGGFKITEVRIDYDSSMPFGRIFVRGKDTMWFGQDSFKINVGF